MPDPTNPTRRELFASAIALGAASFVNPLSIRTGVSDNEAGTFVDLLRPPDLVRAFARSRDIALTRNGPSGWAGTATDIHVDAAPDRLRLTVRATGDVSRVHLRWHADLAKVQRFLGDQWERSYGDLEWRAEAPNRVMAWYFMAFDGYATHGYGVRTMPHAFCFWTADAAGISLWADVRNGGGPVQLGGRWLDVCDIVCRRGTSDESPFAATSAFCAQMCPGPRLPPHTVYGTNDWNYAYGKNSAELIERVSRVVSEHAPDQTNRPYSVIDDGWSLGGVDHGPWRGNEHFGDMGAFAQRLRGIGVRPGIWFRPLTALKEQPDAWRLQRDKQILDPTVPDALHAMSANVRQLRDWGYELLKHDYTSYDLFGRWGFAMDATLTDDNWRFADGSRTNAEIVLDLYHAIRDAAGDMVIIGCTTFSHLSAGLFELYRSGDDTSGRSWDRTRRMGVNTLAFRAAQHRHFYMVDPDIVAITQASPWTLTERWLRLVSSSGAALFVSVDPDAFGPAQATALKAALALAAKPIRTGEPIDWMATQCPREWKLDGKRVRFDWMPDSGSWPFAD